jgi:hypothetical protein
MVAKRLPSFECGEVFDRHPGDLGKRPARQKAHMRGDKDVSETEQQLQHVVGQRLVRQIAVEDVLFQFVYIEPHGVAHRREPRRRNRRPDQRADDAVEALGQDQPACGCDSSVRCC